MSKVIKIKGDFQRLPLYLDQLKKNRAQLGEIEIELLTLAVNTATCGKWNLNKQQRHTNIVYSA